MFSEEEIKRLRWRSRRGMLELDLVLLPFFDQAFMNLPEAQQQTFVKLLEQDDPDLHAWFSRKSSPDDAELAALVDVILKWIRP